MRIRSLFAAALLSAALVGAPSHSEANVLKGSWTFVKDRFNDGLDIFRLRAGVPVDGKGLGAKVRATSLAQAGYVFWKGTYVGLDRRGVGVVQEHRQEGGISLLYGSRNRMVPIAGNMFLKENTDWHRIADRRILRNLPHWDDGRQRHLSLGAEVATPLLGIDVGVYPEEALDFALGFLIIDIFNDDELFGWDTKYLDANTLPGPDPTAPFTKERQEQEEFLLRMLEQELRASGQLDDTPSAAMDQTQPPNAIGEVNTISGEDADALIRDIDMETQTEPYPTTTLDSPAESQVLEPETSIPTEPVIEDDSMPVVEPAEEVAEETEATPTPAAEVDNSRDIRFRPIERTRDKEPVKKEEVEPKKEE